MNRRKVDRQVSQEVAVLEPYLRQAAVAGCRRDQMERFLKVPIFLNPKQLEMSAAAGLCDLPDGPNLIGVGGARGGGKTHWGLMQVGVDDCQKKAGIKFLFLRKIQKSQREQFNDYRNKLFNPVYLPNKWREQAGELKFENGSMIIIGHFKNESDIDQYLGIEYDGMLIEELTTLTYDKFKSLMGSLRSTKEGWRPRCYATWNWGGVGHHFVYKIFWEPYRDNCEKETRYIPAKVYDNPVLVKSNPEYVKYLESLTGWRRKSWLDGDPNIFSGMFFTNWNEEVHVYPRAGLTFLDQDAKSWFASFDHGYAHPCCFLLHARDRNGLCYTVDEYHQAETTIEENAYNFKAMLARHSINVYNLEYIAAGSDCFARRVDKTEARTIADEYGECGVDLTRVDIDRVNAWAVCQQRLGGGRESEVKPTWFIHRNCRNLIAQIPLAQCNLKRPGDVEKMNYNGETEDGGDDALEGWRNGVVAEPLKVAGSIIPIGIGNYQPLIELPRPSIRMPVFH